MSNPEADPFLTARRILLLAVVFGLTVPLLAQNPFYGIDSGTPAKSRSSPGPFIGPQIAFKEDLANALESFGKTGGANPFMAILVAAFAYGILHAAGPGHRKAVIFSLFLAQKTRPWEPLAAGFLSAFIHAATGGAILLVLTLLRGALASLTQAETLVVWIDGITLCILAAMSIALMTGAVLRIARKKNADESTRGKNLYAILVFASMVPCPGAIMVVLFSLYMNAPAAGMAAFVSMSLGMGIVVSAAAYLAWFGRKNIFDGIKRNERAIATVSASFELLSYSLILALSLYSGWPFLVSLFG